MYYRYYNGYAFITLQKGREQMDIGASTACLYPLETEKALYELAIRGVRNVEIFINSVDELEGGIYADMKKTIKEYGVSVKSFHPFSSPMESVFLFGNYSRRTDYLIDMYKKYFEKLAELGAEYFVLHGAILSTHVEDDLYMERYLRLYRIAKEFGVTVLQENICYCKSKDIDFLRKMSDQLGDEVRFVLDTKQARRSGTDAFDYLDAIGDKVAHIHISDCDENCDCLPIGKGVFDFTKLFKRLDELCYDNAMIVELYRENYTSYDDLKDSVTALQKKLDDYR